MPQKQNIKLANGITSLYFDVVAGPGTGAQKATIANTSIAPGTYGDASHVAQVVFNSQGRATSAANIAIAGFSSTAGAVGTWGSSTRIPQITVDSYGRVVAAANIQLEGVSSSALATPGIYGSSSQIPVLTIDSYGRVTAAANVPFTLGLSSSAITPGTYGSGSEIPVITFNSFGQATSVTTAAIAPPTVLDTQVVVFTSSSGRGEIAFTGITSDFLEYTFSFYNVVPVSSSDNFVMQVSYDGGVIYQAASYVYGSKVVGSGGAETVYNSSSDTSFKLAGSVGAGVLSEGVSGYVTMYMPYSSAAGKSVGGKIEWLNTDTHRYTNNFGGSWASFAGPLNAVRFKFDSGNVVSGVIRALAVR